MKRVAVFCLLICTPAIGADNVIIQMLDAQINQLESERAEKQKKLSECEKSVKGFKIAGVSTLTATGVGVSANIKLHNKIKNKGDGAADASRGSAPNQQDNYDDLCREFPDDCE